MSKVLWHTINIQIPDKMINVSKTGKMTIKQSLTKKGNITRANNEPSVIFKTNSTIDKPIIKESGKVENVEAIKLRQKKLKIIKDRLIKLPNKPKITKAEFVSKAKAKVAQKIQARQPKTERLKKEIKYYSNHLAQMQGYTGTPNGIYYDEHHILYKKYKDHRDYLQTSSDLP